MDKMPFKARKIPKSHKIPFMVYHSTKDLTAFKNLSKCEKQVNRLGISKLRLNSGEFRPKCISIAAPGSDYTNIIEQSKTED